MATAVKWREVEQGYNINDYLGPDILFEIFKIVVSENPYALMRCGQVCTKWEDLTNHDTLWKKFAKELKYFEKSKEHTFRQEISAKFAQSRAASMRVKNDALSSYQTVRQFVFTAFTNKINKMPPGAERSHLAAVRNELQVERESRLVQLEAAFFWNLNMAALKGADTLTLAKRIASVLASDCYLKKGPLEEITKYAKAASAVA